MANESRSRPFTFWLGVMLAIPGLVAAAAVVVLFALHVLFGKVSVAEARGPGSLTSGVLVVPCTRLCPRAPILVSINLNCTKFK